MVFAKRGKRRFRGLREEIFASKAKNHLELDHDDSTSKEESFLASTPGSLKGTFLRNKLENPLFRPIVLSLSKRSSLSKVKHASDCRSEEEEDSEDEDEVSSSDDDEECDEDSEVDSQAEKSQASVKAKFKQSRKGSTLKTLSLKSSSRSRFRSSFFEGRVKRSFLFSTSPLSYSYSSNFDRRGGKNTRKPKNKRSRARKGRRRLSIDSSTSIGSRHSSTSKDTYYDNESELDVDTLTKLERTPNKSPLSKSSTTSPNKVASTRSSAASNSRLEKEASFVMYTQKGEAVRLQFYFDYLLISPISKLSLSLSPAGYRSKNKLKLKPRIVYYEDLASWTNNNNCLRLIHIKKKNTAEQERSEIKLFTSKKKVVASTHDLNELLKDRVSILVAARMNCGVDDARKMLERNVSDNEMKKVVQKIDKSGQRCLAESYSKDLIDSSQCFALYNV